jgi:hypothetical protein
MCNFSFLKALVIEGRRRQRREDCPSSYQIQFKNVAFSLETGLEIDESWSGKRIVLVNYLLDNSERREAFLSTFRTCYGRRVTTLVLMILGRVIGLELEIVYSTGGKAGSVPIHHDYSFIVEVLLRNLWLFSSS